MTDQRGLPYQRGFTLAEMLVIVAILAVLFGLAALALRGLRPRAETVAQQAEYDVVDKALQICRLDDDCAAQITPVASPQVVGPETPGFGGYLRRSSRYEYTWDSEGALTTFLAVDSGGFNPSAPFSGQEPPSGWQLGEDATLTAGDEDPVDNGWLRLTDEDEYENGYAYYDQAFDSTNGLTIFFDFIIWGGSGADGLSFFLFDGSTETFSAGGYGGSLGYAPHYHQTGLSNGYLGVGFDEFGNYSNPTEGRIGGPGREPDAIAIRGPHNVGGGYEYLTGTLSLGESIDITGGSTRPDADAYRHAEIRLERKASGATVEVWVRFGAGDTLHQIIPPTPVSDPPATLKLGFAGSTGSVTNYHEVRNIGIQQ
jgi:prepilin-type N-terminal cleavage/methylation domain-containing protein